MKFSQKNFMNWRFWKMHFFWVGHFEFFFSKKIIFFCLFPMKISQSLLFSMDGSKGEGESVLCEGIWNGNLQFCPKWLSKGLYRSKISCPIQWNAQNDSQTTVNRLFSRKTCFLTTFFTNFWTNIHTFINVFCQKKHIFGPLCINLSTPLDPTWNFL